MASFTVYILYSQKLDRYYTGYSENPELRLVQHNQGISVYTSKANDWIIVYREAFSTRQAAQRREREIKNKKSRSYIEGLICTGG